MIILMQMDAKTDSILMKITKPYDNCKLYENPSSKAGLFTQLRDATGKVRSMSSGCPLIYSIIRSSGLTLSPPRQNH